MEGGSLERYIFDIIICLYLSKDLFFLYQGLSESALFNILFYTISQSVIKPKAKRAQVNAITLPRL
jgi:hypothetical protein